MGVYPWIDRFFGFFSGDLSDEQLLSNASTEVEKYEAHYYVVMKEMLAGRVGHARDALRKCVTMNLQNVMETDFARARLKQLAPSGNAP